MAKNDAANTGNPFLVSLDLHEPMPVGLDQARVTFSPWKQRENALRWQTDWGKRERRPLLLGGPSGCGKKTLAFAIANFMGRRVFCLDARELDRPERHPTSISSSDPFDFVPRLVLVTQADAKSCGTVNNRSNRGAMQSLESRVPVIYVCSNPFKESMTSLRQRCVVVTLGDLEKSAMDEVAAFSMRRMNLVSRLAKIGKPKWLIDQDVHRLVETSGGDARKLKKRLENYVEFGSMDLSGDSNHRTEREREKATSLKALAEWMSSGSSGRARERTEFLERRASSCRFLFEGTNALAPSSSAVFDSETKISGEASVGSGVAMVGNEKDNLLAEMSLRCRGQGAVDTGFDVGKAPPSDLFNDVAILLRAPFLCAKFHITDESDRRTQARALYRRETRFLREDGSCGLVALSPDEKIADDQFEYLWQLYPTACEQFTQESQISFSRLGSKGVGSTAEFGRRSFLEGLCGASELFSRIALVTSDPDQRIKAGTAAGVLAARVGFAMDPGGLIRRYLPFVKPVRESFSHWFKSRAAETTLKDLWRNLCFADPDLSPYRNRTNIHLDLLPLLNRRILGGLLPSKGEVGSASTLAGTVAKKTTKPKGRGTATLSVASSSFFDLEGKEPWLGFVRAPEKLDLTLWKGAWDRLSTSLTDTPTSPLLCSGEIGGCAINDFVPADRLRSAWVFNFDDVERKKEIKKLADSAKLKKMPKDQRTSATSSNADSTIRHRPRAPSTSIPSSSSSATRSNPPREEASKTHVDDQDPVNSLFQDIETLARGGTVSTIVPNRPREQSPMPEGWAYEEASGWWIPPPVVLKPCKRIAKRTPSLSSSRNIARGSAVVDSRPIRLRAPIAGDGFAGIVDVGTVVDSDGRVIRKRRLV